MSLADIGATLGVSSQTVWLWETARRRPSNRHVEDYAAVISTLRAAIDDHETPGQPEEREL